MTQKALALHSILEKVQHGIPLTGEEFQQLQSYIHSLELEEAAPDQLETYDEGEPLTELGVGRVVSGHATRGGTERFAAHASGNSTSFYRSAQDLVVSSVGIGTYRGAMNNEVTADYCRTVRTALNLGVNLIDTSLNYRHQRSERAVGEGIRRFIESDGGRRDEVVVCTKSGFLVPGAITPGTLTPDDVVGGAHSLAPPFLADQLERSRRNLGLEVIDVYYLHNPEIQLQFIQVPEFLNRIRTAFEWLERAVSDGLIQYYGTATWEGYRVGALSLHVLAEIARQVGGETHHFRFVQLPFNLQMREAMAGSPEDIGVLDVAVEVGVTVFASAALWQGRLSRDLPDEIAGMMSDLNTKAQRAIQFVRSTPGITSALVGMRQTTHLEENLAVAMVPPLSSATYRRLCSTLLVPPGQG